MKTHNLCDACIRPSLRPMLLAQHRAKDPKTILIEELGLCQGRARVDIALVRNILHGYEIKSDRDSLSRLGKQVSVYNKIFDQATLVASTRHIDKALKIIPQWWGVIQVKSNSDGPLFNTIRKAHQNPSKDARSIVELIWHKEAINLLEQRNLARGIRSKPRKAAWDRLCETFSIDEISEIVRKKLTTRAKLTHLPLQ